MSAEHDRGRGQHRRTTTPSYSTFVGRVGALAVALGVGVGFATATSSLAWADETDTSSPSDSQPVSAPAEPSATDTDAPATPAAAEPVEPESQSANDSPADDTPSGTPEPGVAQASTVHTGSYGPNAVSTEEPTAEPKAEAPRVVTPVAVDPVEPSNDHALATPESQTPPTTPAVVHTSDPTPPTSQPVANAPDVATPVVQHVEPVVADPGAAAAVSTPIAAVAPAPIPQADRLAAPAPAVDVAIGFVGAILAPFLAPTPGAPVQPPVLLVTILEWVRREVQRTFFNSSPVGFDNAYTTSEDDDVTGNVLTDGTADTDADGDALRATVVAGPAHGDLVLNPDGSFTYTPDENYTGADTFTYRVSDTGFHLHGIFGFFAPDGGHTDTAAVTITVTPGSGNHMPDTMGDNLVVQNGSLTVASPGVLANDTDVDGDSLTAVQFSDPSHGSVTLNADGGFTYTPDADYFGADSFEYYADDGTTSGSLAFVNILVTEDLPNAAPVANYDSFATETGTALTFGSDDLLDNDFDAEGDPLTVAVTQTTSNGTLVDNGDGTYTYTPDDGFTGIDSFEYAASDAIGPGNVAVVSINVGVPANSVPVAAPDLVSTRVDTPRYITPADLLTNDTDADGEALAAYVVSDPAYGTLEEVAGGGWLYTPDPGYSGLDSFYYTAFDGYADSTPTLVTVQVAGQANGNSPAVAGYDSVGTAFDAPLTIDTNTLLANDFDADGDPLTVVVTQWPQFGTLTDDGAGNLVYTPDAGFTGYDSFFYSAGYPENASLPAEVTITVGGIANTAPVAAPDDLVTGIGQPLTFDPLANDTDADGDGLASYVVSAPGHGTLDDNGDGTYTYTPDAGYVGADGFYYTAYDGRADSLPTLVTIDVGGAAPNEPPVAGDDYLATGVDEPLIITLDDLVGNDFDADGDVTQASGSIVDFPSHGTFEPNPVGDGSAIYTPDPGFEGVDTFTYQLNDGVDDSNLATVYITVGSPTPAELSTTTGTPLRVEFAPLNAYIVTQPSHGTLACYGDAYTYTPDAGFTGTDGFVYTAFDCDAHHLPAAVTITVT